MVETRSSDFPVPFVRSYWVRPGRLLAGFYPGDKDSVTADQKLKGLIRCGVSTVINLMEEKEKNHSGDPFVEYAQRLQECAKEAGREVLLQRFSIRDLSIPTVDRMSEILDAIDQALLREGAVYVHCWGGRGRTGTVVGCHLLRHRLVTQTGALDAVKSLTEEKRQYFWPTPEMPCQLEFVSKWQLGQ